MRFFYTVFFCVIIVIFGSFWCPMNLLVFCEVVVVNSSVWSGAPPAAEEKLVILTPANTTPLSLSLSLVWFPPCKLYRLQT